MTKLLNSANTIAIVFGAHDWNRSSLGAAPSFRRSAARFTAYLTAPPPFGLGIDAELTLSLFDDPAPASAQLVRIHDFIRSLVRERSDGANPIEDILIYYVGHGICDNGNALHFLVRDTGTGIEEQTSISAVDLSRVLRTAAPHQRRLVILDCCFSEAAASAFGSMGAFDDAVAATAAKNLAGGDTQVRGTLVLCSSPRAQISIGHPNAEYTLFSGALLSVLREGSDLHPSNMISFAELRDAVYTRMLGVHAGNPPMPALHQPDQRAGDITHIPAFPNPGFERRRLENAEAERRISPKERRKNPKRGDAAGRKAKQVSAIEMPPRHGAAPSTPPPDKNADEPINNPNAAIGGASGVPAPSAESASGEARASSVTDAPRANAVGQRMKKILTSPRWLLERWKRISYPDRRSQFVLAGLILMIAVSAAIALRFAPAPKPPLPANPAVRNVSPPQPPITQTFTVKSCNKTSTAIFAAFSYKAHKDGPWHDEGWTKLAAGECGVAFVTEDKTYFSYAIAEDHSIKWGGSSTICGNPSKSFAVDEAQGCPKGYIKLEGGIQLIAGENWTQDFTTANAAETSDAVTNHQATICNNTPENLDTAYSYKSQDDKTWHDAGWWNLAPGDCVRPFTSPTTTFFYYANSTTGSGKWEGASMLCAKTEAFDVDESSAGQCPDGYTLHKAIQEKMSGVDYTLLISPKQQ
ncbi:MAG TPA: DUF1036 domain-containing protein [Rhizomicrobium sp.]